MRTALLLSAIGLTLGCTPRADQVFTVPGRITTGSSGAQPGYAIKLVQAKQAPSEIVADDGSLCRLTAERFSQVGVGEWIACGWTIASETAASSGDSDSTAIVDRRHAYDHDAFEIAGERDGTSWGSVRGKYLVVWRRQGDTWRRHLDMWNSGPQPPS